jgi:hypothetical protein
MLVASLTTPQARRRRPLRLYAHRRPHRTHARRRIPALRLADATCSGAEREPPPLLAPGTAATSCGTDE